MTKDLRPDIPRLPYGTLQQPGSIRLNVRLSPGAAETLQKLSTCSQTAVLDLALETLRAAVDADPVLAEGVGSRLTGAADFDQMTPRRLRHWAKGFRLIACALEREALRVAEALTEVQDGRE